MWKFDVKFVLPFTLTGLEIQVGLDAGNGAAIIVNEEIIYASVVGINWEEKWENNDVIDINLPYLQGENTIIIYAKQDIANNKISMRFRHNGGEWYDLIEP